MLVFIPKNNKKKYFKHIKMLLEQLNSLAFIDFGKFLNILFILIFSYNFLIPKIITYIYI